MKKFCLILALLLCLLCLTPVSASAQALQGLAQGKPLSTESYTATAKAVVLYERNTDTLVYAHQPDLRLNPTGLVKVLTALIALEEGNPDDVVTVKRATLNSVGVGVVSAGLEAGEEISLRDLLYCIMVSSANDACAVVAEHIAGTQGAFVEKMNERAATLGCVNTHFTNVHGLQDEKQYSTARDLAIITAEALRNPELTAMFGLVSYTVPATNKSAARNLTTTNYLMNPQSPYYDARVTGGKPAAASTRDRSLVCTAEAEGSRYLCVVMSAQAKMSGNTVKTFTNFQEASKLLDMGFEGFRAQQVLSADQPYGLYAVAGGENHVVVSPEETVSALLPVDFDKSKLQFEAEMDDAKLTAPLSAGEIVGTLKVSYNGVSLGTFRLRACHGVAAAGTVIQPAQAVKRGISLKWMILGGGVVMVLLGGAALLWVRGRRKGGKR